MASWAETIRLRASDKDPQVRKMRAWTEVVFQLDSQAQGETRIGIRNKRAPIEPGSVYRMTIAPDSQLEADTTSSSPVQVQIWYTEHTWIDDALRVLCEIAAGVGRG